MSDETMRQNDSVPPMRRGQRLVSESIPLNDTEHYRSGILIFSPRQKLLHANRRALKLIGHPDQAETKAGSEIHSEPVRELLIAVQAALDNRRDANMWGPFKLKRILFEARRKILVCGIGLGDRNSHDDSRILIVLEEVGLRQERSEPQRQAMGPSQERGGAAIQGSVKRGPIKGCSM